MIIFGQVFGLFWLVVERLPVIVPVPKSVVPPELIVIEPVATEPVKLSAFVSVIMMFWPFAVTLPVKSLLP